MLRISLVPLLNSRGIHKPYTFLRGLGISHGAAHRLCGKSAVISLSHLERICRRLNCTPNELMEYVPQEASPLAEGHALLRLVRREMGDITQQLSALPPEAVDKVWELIAELKEQK